MSPSLFFLYMLKKFQVLHDWCIVAYWSKGWRALGESVRPAPIWPNEGARS